MASKKYDMSKQLELGVFKQLKYVILFNQAYVSHGTVVWNEYLDLCPDELYYNSVPI